MKKILVVLLLSACSALNIPEDFVYKEIETPYFRLASWQKISDKSSPFKIYIEGDGAAFRSSGIASSNPTPKGILLREIAFGDKNENVIYLARPCQFVDDIKCETKYWSLARFSPEVVVSTYYAIKNIAKNNDITLVGFSGGAQISGLVAVKYNDLKIKKLITIAGNLDVETWINHHNVTPLYLSETLTPYKAEYKKFPQIHYVGTKDTIIPHNITKNFIGDENKIITIDSASHTKGWNSIYDEIRQQY